MNWYCIHWYRDWKSWSIGFSITVANASLALGPLWLALFWKRSF